MNTVLDARAAQFTFGGFLAIYPETYFTCNGNILSWTFGARWTGLNQFPELQIWRSSGNESYTKVGSTTIITERNLTNIYKYPLSPPLSFQEGDILGYYQPPTGDSLLHLQYEIDGQPQRVYHFNRSFQSVNEIQLTNRPFQDKYQALIDAETGESILV